MAPFFVISLCDILYELPEPHGVRGAVLCGKSQHYKQGPFVGKP
jgi:energy-converting hydrogenase Eha subunit B